MNRLRIGLSGLLTPVVATLGACTDTVAPGSDLAHPVPAVTASGIKSQRLEIFDDAEGRILPAMVDQARRLELEDLIQQLSTAQRSGDLATARRALTAARKLLDRMAFSEHPANISAIRLGLVNAEALLATPDQLADQ